MTRPTIRSFGPILLALLLLVLGGPTMAIEEPAYQILRQTPDFELRRYEPHLLAEVEVRGDFDEVGGEAFRILAGYIFGDNQGESRIAMTAPVSQQPVGTRIEMTAPVSQQPTGAAADTYVVSFVMPARFTLATLPVPSNPRVRLREQPARLMAVHRYSGSWAESGYRKHESRLLDALGAAGLTPLGQPIYARYNSPFSLPFLRRNEVMVEVAEPAQTPVAPPAHPAVRSSPGSGQRAADPPR